MTPAERKRAQRERDVQAMAEAVGKEQNAPLRVLLAILSRVDDSDGACHSAQRAWVEIGRRCGFVMVTPHARPLKNHRGDTDGE